MPAALSKLDIDFNVFVTRESVLAAGHVSHDLLGEGKLLHVSLMSPEFI